MVYRIEITYYEIVDTLDNRFIAGSTIGYTIRPGVYKITDFKLMLKSLLLKEVKVKNKTDVVRLKSTLFNNKTSLFCKKSFSIILYVLLNSIHHP